MSLEKWAEYGWLKAEPTSPGEIADLLGIVHRDLHDAKVEAISEDRRFEAAFNAARTAANVALRASGYRTSVQVGHHLKTIESLELTVQAEPRLIQKMRVFSKKEMPLATIPPEMFLTTNLTKPSTLRTNSGKV
jgi:hypothetical protein